MRTWERCKKEISLRSGQELQVCSKEADGSDGPGLEMMSDCIARMVPPSFADNGLDSFIQFSHSYKVSLLTHNCITDNN